MLFHAGMPDVVDRLIEALGLGSVDNAVPQTVSIITSDSSEQSVNITYIYPPRRQASESLCPSTGNNGFICTGLPYSNGELNSLLIPLHAHNCTCVHYFKWKVHYIFVKMLMLWQKMNLSDLPCQEL